MNEGLLVKAITYFGERAIVACDGCCDKAWGINSRPTAPLSDDPDDYEFLGDDELGVAPVDPGTSEGRDSKPADYDDPLRQNKWCTRECERSTLVTPAGLPDFAARVRNIRVDLAEG